MAAPPITAARAEVIARAIAGAAATATAIHRVERLDRGHPYHLVVFANSGAPGAPGLIVAIDEVTGDIMGSARLGAIEGSWAPRQAEAARRLGDESAREARLVWAPSRASLSPFYPLWEFTTPSGPVYVDRDGRIWRDLPSAGPG